MLLFSLNAAAAEVTKFEPRPAAVEQEGDTYVGILLSEEDFRTFINGAAALAAARRGPRGVARGRAPRRGRDRPDDDQDVPRVDAPRVPARADPRRLLRGRLRSGARGGLARPGVRLLRVSIFLYWGRVANLPDKLINVACVYVIFLIQFWNRENFSGIEKISLQNWRLQ